MRVAFVGGMDRNESALIAAGKQRGIEVEVHYGDVKGRGADALEGIVHRADHVIVVTGVNSHGGVKLAKQFAHAHGKHVWIMRACGLALAKRVLDDVATGRDLTQVARAA
jgi:hypothetical protein